MSLVKQETAKESNHFVQDLGLRVNQTDSFLLSSQ